MSSSVEATESKNLELDQVKLVDSLCDRFEDDWLAGKPATEASFAEAGELAKNAASPISAMRGTAAFRLNLVGVLTRRALAIAVARAVEV